MSKYYLVSRNKITNNCKIISLVEDWYLKNGSLKTFRSNKLENIDIVTMQFKNYKQLIGQMYKNGYIDSEDIDLFITTCNGGKIHFDELVFNDNKYVNGNLYDMANFSVHGMIGEKSGDIENIYRHFADRIKNDDNFNAFVNECNVFYVLVDGIRKCSNEKELNIFFIKNKWLLSSYLAIRNVVESMERYDDMSFDVIDHNLLEREKICNKLLEMIDKNYIDGQLNMFDVMGNVKKYVYNEEDCSKQVVDDDWIIPDEAIGDDEQWVI